MSRFIAAAGAAWGARREVIDQAQGPIAECGFNELALDVRITWRGQPPPLSATRPTKEEMLTDD